MQSAAGQKQTLSLSLPPATATDEDLRALLVASSCSRALICGGSKLEWHALAADLTDFMSLLSGGLLRETYSKSATVLALLIPSLFSVSHTRISGASSWHSSSAQPPGRARGWDQLALQPKPAQGGPWPWVFLRVLLVFIFYRRHTLHLQTHATSWYFSLFSI